jgi:hypothetical protein
MKKLKPLLVFIFLIFTLGDLCAQNRPVVAVDGYFTKKDSSFVFEYLGKNLIKQIDAILPDSAKKIIGDQGKYGIVNFSTYNPNNEKVKLFRNNENKLFQEKPVTIVNGMEVKNFEMSMLDPAKIISVEILTPLRSAQKFGKDRKSGVVIIKVNKD